MTDYVDAGAQIAAGDPVKGLEELIGSIGSGRREANVITPVQNQMWNSVVAAYNEAQMASLARCVQLRDQVSQLWTSFSNWVQMHPWTDGRAAQQALDVTKDPYKSVQGVLANIDTRIAYLSAGGSGATGSDTTVTATAVPATAPGGKGVIYVGGGLLVAKMLGFL